MNRLENLKDGAIGRGGLRDLIRDLMPYADQKLENDVFQVASEWGRRTKAYEKEASALWAEEVMSNGVTVLSAAEVGNAIRNRTE